MMVPAELVDLLVRRNVLSSSEGAEVVQLAGGVSCDVLLVTAGRQRVVVKRPLRRLRVAQRWTASPSRALREAEALGLASEIRPANVPRLLDLEPDRLLLVMEAAPEDMHPWKLDLLEGQVETHVAQALGDVLADWHSTTSEDPDLAAGLADTTNFSELRISPFFLTVAKVHPDLAGPISAVVAQLTQRATCLVHGDFSPKNVLVGPTGLWVIDWETAHRGDPTFDLAFLLAHLVCKAVHRPELATDYERCATAFLDTYLDRTRVAIAPTELLAQTACLVLARVDGTSPVEYLDQDQRRVARALGRDLLLGDGSGPASIWAALRARRAAAPL
jgi:aminoglycoside phosphotransferase (APT) family kinase protein